MDGIRTGWLTRIKEKMPLHLFPWKSWNRVCNVLETCDMLGGHIEKHEDGRGWVWVVDDEDGDVFPFAVEYDDGTARVYLGGDEMRDTLVIRNGATVHLSDEVSVDSDGYAEVSASHGSVLYVEIEQGDDDVFWTTNYDEGAMWSIGASTSTEFTSISARGAVPIAYIDTDGNVVQLRRSVINDTFHDTDTAMWAQRGDDKYWRSIEVVQESGSDTFALQLRGFRGGTITGNIDESTTMGDTLSVITREKVDTDKYHIGYRRIVFPSPYIPEYDEAAKDYFGTPCPTTTPSRTMPTNSHPVVWDPCTGETWYLDEWLKAKKDRDEMGFWKTGGDSSTCTASTIDVTTRADVRALQVTGNASIGDHLTVNTGIDTSTLNCGFQAQVGSLACTGAAAVGSIKVNGVAYTPTAITYVDAGGVSHTITVLAQ